MIVPTREIYTRPQLNRLVSQINRLLKRRFGKDAGRCWVTHVNGGACVVRLWKGGPKEFMEVSGALELKLALENLWVKGLAWNG